MLKHQEGINRRLLNEAAEKAKSLTRPITLPTKTSNSKEADITDVEAEDAAVAAVVAAADVEDTREEAVAVDAEAETLHTPSVPRRSRSSISESIWIKRSVSNTAVVAKVTPERQEKKKKKFDS